MSMISEQVKELKWYASYQECEKVSSIMYQAADTIESLSAKLQAADMEKNEILKKIREKAQELSNQHWSDDERHLVGKGIQCMCVQAENIIKANMERSSEDCGGNQLLSRSHDISLDKSITHVKEYRKQYRGEGEKVIDRTYRNRICRWCNENRTHNNDKMELKTKLEVKEYEKNIFT